MEISKRKDELYYGVIVSSEAQLEMIALAQIVMASFSGGFGHKRFNEKLEKASKKNGYRLLENNLCRKYGYKNKYYHKKT